MVRQLSKLFVSNLPWTIGTEQLKKFIAAEFGRVVAVNVVFDKKTGISQRYGFIEVPKETLDNIQAKQGPYRLEGNNIFFRNSE